MRCGRLLKLLSKRYRLTLSLLCALLFLLQISYLLYRQVRPLVPSTVLEQRLLTRLPILAKVCFSPAFHLAVLNSAGYQSTEHFFLGKTWRFIGWTGDDLSHNISGRKLKIV